MATILVVDDERDVVELLRDVFVKHGHEVDTAQDGAQALELLRNKRYDGMVLDLLMPGISGQEVMAQRAVFPDTAVIVLTAHGSEDAAIQAIKARVNDYIKKPFNLKELVKLMEHYIGRHEVGEFMIDMASGTAFYQGREIKKLSRSGGLFEIFEMFVKNPEQPMGYMELAELLFKTYPRHADQRPDLAEKLKSGSAELEVVKIYLAPQMSRLRSALKKAAGFDVLIMKHNVGFGWSYKALHPDV